MPLMKDKRPQFVKEWLKPGWWWHMPLNPSAQEAEGIVLCLKLACLKNKQKAQNWYDKLVSTNIR